MSLIDPDERAAILARAYPDEPSSQDDDGGLSVGWNGRRIHGWAAVMVGTGIVLTVIIMFPVLVLGHVMLRLTGRRGFAYRELGQDGHSVWRVDTRAAFDRYPE